MPFQFRKEAIEEDLNSNFPSQGQGNPPLYYSLSEVVVPTYSINTVAEGSSLPEMLQTAWDFSTGNQRITGGSPTTTIINNTGFWKVQAEILQFTGNVFFSISDGLSSKKLLAFDSASGTVGSDFLTQPFIVYLRSGDSLTYTTNVSSNCNVWYRQVADLNGNLVNPLGFSFA